MSSQLSPTGRILAVTASAGLAAFIWARLRANYLAWLSLGRGGLRSDVIGWAVNWIAYAFANKDTRSADAFYDRAKGAQTGDGRGTSFLPASLLPRSGMRPDVPAFVIPQRQTSAKAPVGEVRAAQRAAFEALAARHAGSVAVRLSRQEGGHGSGLWLVDEGTVASLPAWAASTRGEIAHVHWEADGSGHCTLSLRDAREVVSKGWGERHMLSGVRAGLFGRGPILISAGYTMVYAPRTVEEVEVQMSIFEAAVTCMGG
ncbi:MAG: hypothetical protein INR71_08025 [Terriglobus roseus]|nr:hypothetical protein [Terriglobus roseus]